MRRVMNDHAITRTFHTRAGYHLKRTQKREWSLRNNSSYTGGLLHTSYITAQPHLRLFALASPQQQYVAALKAPVPLIREERLNLAVVPKPFLPQQQHFPASTRLRTHRSARHAGSLSRSRCFSTECPMYSTIKHSRP